LSIYADTSFFVSLYLTDRHTTEAERRLASRPTLWMTPLHVAEWTHAVEQHVFRKAISRSEADLFLRRFNDHLARGLWRKRRCPNAPLKSVRNWDSDLGRSWVFVRLTHYKWPQRWNLRQSVSGRSISGRRNWRRPQG